MEQLITSKSNQIVKHVKSLHKKKKRWNSKNYFIEGIRGVKESIISKGQIEYILYSDSLFNVKGGKDLFNLIINNGYKVFHISEEILKYISDTQNSQGIIAALKFDIKSLENILIDRGNFLILLDRVQDPGNIGTIIRTADAFGVSGIILTNGCVDVYNPKVVRSTMGSILRVPIAFERDINNTLNKLKERNIKIVSTALDAEYYSYDFDFTKDFVLVVGNEASGVSKDIQNQSDFNVKIPMIGETESLNVAVATSILMYEATSQRKNLQINR
ncbi:23S rRNA (guanosine(2251)-2'-O)-methyltransferase RlmB [Caldisalinibacter kiritimatiensis]|uniref:RNA methyltransferase, TrmH family, group 3 n=1 Tax=Caldisalinibacter kiritimatiensis TaxID=1304284 RepID=R1CQH5_9FIRM|nr:23S rRNA (guanosine(2251)-2'-O)-methyltransferase RlmB [Caldisalinibacter kiritimatiensis]EOD00921.1 RNA methyltransferase, TrmH family, group 3 [Caldisalinibacter kiritimatiensis]